MSTASSPRATPATADGDPTQEGMRWIPGGTFAMGSEDFYPEERPVHRVSVDGFWMDETWSPQPISGGSFARRGTSPSPSGRSTPSSTRTPTPVCSFPARSSSTGPPAR